jgi:hypothetical protein
MVPVVAEGRRQPLHSDHNYRADSGRGSDLLFRNLETTKIVKLLHATALALVGWYMIIPPSSGIRRPGYPRTNPAAPLSRWSFYNESWDHDAWPPADRAHAKEFDLKAACEAKKEKVYPAHPPPIPRTAGGDMTERIETYREFGSHTICVSSGDPRFKEK